MTTTHDEYQALTGDGRKAFDADRAARRREPLPPNTWYVASRLNKSPRWWAGTRLVITGPRQVTIHDGIVDERRIDVQRIKRGWLRRSRIVLIDADGVKTRIKARYDGELGAGDIALSIDDTSFLGGLASGLGSDAISAVIGFVVAVLWLLSLPYVCYRSARRTAAARRIVRAVKNG